jgi:integrase
VGAGKARGLTVRITRRFLDKLKPGSERGTRYQDRDLPGFYAAAYPRRVSFFVRYRIDGQRHTLKIGDFPSTMPEAARRAALSVLGGAARGEDEAAKRKALREAADASAKRLTFAAWREEYVRTRIARLKEQNEPTRYLAMAGEAWDRRPLADITARDVETFRNRLAERGSTQANRWLATVAGSFNHAFRLGHVEKNPCALVQRLPENAPRQRVLTNDEEIRLRRVLSTWRNPFEKVALTLLLDTGARLSEVLRARHEDFDLDRDGAGTWRIPSSKSGKAQAIPVLPHVGVIVLATPKLDGGPFLVPGRNALVRRADFSRPWGAAKAAARLGADLHIHDLRRSFGLRVTRESGIYAASKLLRHADSRITERVYAPLDAGDLMGFAVATERARVLSFKRKKAVAK